jgi:hypothetical protein
MLGARVRAGETRLWGLAKEKAAGRT